MYIAIDEILQSQGKTRYWLAQKINCNYQTIVNICENNTTKISINFIEDICKALNCTPNDIFIIED